MQICVSRCVCGLDRFRYECESVCVQLCVCTDMCMQVCWCAGVVLCVGVHVQVYVFRCLFRCVYTGVCTGMCVQVCVHTGGSMQVCVLESVCVHLCVYAYRVEKKVLGAWDPNYVPWKSRKYPGKPTTATLLNQHNP